MQDLITYLKFYSPVLVPAVPLLLVLLLSVWRKPWRMRLRRKPLMTPNEAEFFRRLERALPAYRVFPQVAFAAFLTHERIMSRRRLWSVRARFDRKIADYVVCDGKTLEIVALIELDDVTHIARVDRARDAMTKTAGYQTFGFQSRQKPTIAEIAALFQHSQAWIREWTEQARFKGRSRACGVALAPSEIAMYQCNLKVVRS